METYFGRGRVCSDKISDEYVSVNNFGYIKDVEYKISVKRDNGRLDYQVIYIDKGYGSFVINDELVRLGSGSMVILHPGEKNVYEFYENTDYYWIHFSGYGVNEILTKLKLTGNIFKPGMFFGFKENMDKMVKLCVVTDFTSETALSAALMTILASAAKKIYVAETPMNKVIEMMQKENYCETKNEEYAKICGVSEHYFIRKFKKVTGLTPHQYKAKLAVERAIEILTTSNLNISETAYSLGFDDSLYFSRLFKKHTGISPMEFKKNNCPVL